MIGQPDIIVRPFLANDLQFFQLLPDQAKHHPTLSPAEIKALEDEITFTVLCDDVICGIFGMVTPWPGRGQGWAYISNSMPRRAWPDITRRLISSIASLMNGLGLHRFEITVAADHPEAIRWADRLGFTQEAKLRKYGPDGSDFFLYVITA